MEIQYLTTQVGVGLATALIQTLLIGGLQLIWQWMSNKFSRVNGGLLFVNRKYYIIISHFILAFVAAGVVYILPEAFSAVLTVAISVGWVLLLLELKRFWSLGLTHTQTKVPLYTYATSLKLSHSDFRLIGVNGFNFCKLVELEGAVRRICDSSGRLQLLLCHPDSEALTEAAIQRGHKDDFYKNQALYSLGRLIALSQRYPNVLDIKIYEASTVQELPIFRAMFLNEQVCVASIAVYGRPDNGRSLPQILADGHARRGRYMYDVLLRYYKAYRKRTRQIDGNLSKRALLYMNYVNEVGINLGE